MRLLVLANRDIYSCCALNQLLPTLESGGHNITLWLSAQVGKQTNITPELARLKHFEQTLFVETIFPALENANIKSKFLSFTQLAERFCQDDYRLENQPNSKAGLAQLEQLTPDLVLSIRYGKILKSALLQIPKFGTLNLHSGKLPNYPGVMATFRAMLKQDHTIHATLHSIDNGRIDQGDIIAMSNSPLDLQKCYFSNTLSLYDQATKLMSNAVQKIDQGEKLRATPQVPSDCYYSFPNKNELDDFHNKGLILVDEAAVNNLIQSHFTTQDEK